MRRLAIATALLLYGCGGAVPPPKIVSVDPAESPASAVVQVRVKLEALLPSSVNYDKSTATAATAATIFVGDTNVGDSNVDPTGTVSALVPSILTPGTYDVRVLLSDGRSATAPQAFTVTPGVWPQSYTIDPIPDVTSGAAFPITVRAVGGAGTTFSGNVMLSVSKAAIRPTVSTSFVSGVLNQSVTLTAKNSNVTITVRDSNGATGTSNTFHVQ
ncbi:MAG: hypothetical protein ACJ790_09605 [Myxococcaceae bacterium]